MTTATDTVHVEIPHLTNHALYEGAVNWAACSAVAVESAIAGRESRIPDAGNAKRLWQQMLSAGQTTGGHGATLRQCVWALASRGYHNLEILDYPANLDALHQLVKDAGVAGDPVVLLVTNGQALPDNERGVQGHFVVSAGIDSARGYLILNGDTQTAIAHQATYGVWPACSNVPTNWATWATLVAAQVCGAIRVKSNTPAPTPVASAPTTPPQVAQALAAVESASQALATAEAALKAL
ncbi:MAG TPA: hypothetical protein VFN78_02565 [Ktedonobacterales bacterium]|nr:hypothetical protein [Ktedonobacterales bacterium]